MNTTIPEETTAMNLRDWIGCTETATDSITPTPYAALSATLDRSTDRKSVV